MLKANDAGEMKEWLNAISSEAVRTEERRVIDWWTDLFGSVSIFVLRLCKLMRAFVNCVLFRLVQWIPNPCVKLFVNELHQFE